MWDNWHGTVLESKRDKTNLNYSRNRYYDPQTGRFTQEDPIGLAGGLNLYGFAQGDPVNFADPFGLVPCGKLKAKIQRLTSSLRGRIQRFQQHPFEGWNSGQGRPFQHDVNIAEEQEGLRQNIEEYRENCKDDDDDFNNFNRSLEGVESELLQFVPQPKLVAIPDGFTFSPADALDVRTPSPQQVRNAAGVVTAGVVLYWVVSELSRLFPPRNLIPVP